MGLNSYTSRCAVGAALFAVATLMAGTVLAQQDDPKVRAQALFQQGLEAVNAGDCTRAMSLLQLSKAAYPARGTLLNMADCEAKLGKVASAWIHLKELVALLEPGDPRLAVAQEKIAALEPRVPRLVVEVPPGAPAPTAILMDGEPLPAGSVGAELPVDPGDHVLAVTWPGSKAEETRVSLAEGVRQVVRLEPPASKPPSAPAARSTTWQPAVADSLSPPSYRRPLGFVVGGIGLAGIGVGAVTGILAIETKSDLAEACPASSACNQEGLDLASKGEALTTTSTVAFIVGLAGLGGGVVLLLTSPDSPNSTALAPAALPGGGGAILRGRF